MLALKNAVPPPPFATLPVPDTVWPAVAVETLAPEGALYREGDSVRRWFRLLGGTVRIVRGLADGRRHVAEFVFPGQIFGIEPGPRRLFAAEAVEPATVLAYPLDAIEQRMAQDHLARRAVRQLLAEHLVAAQLRAVTLGSFDGAERVAGFLAAMARRHPTGRIAVLAMNRTDIADHLGLTVETLSRLLTALRRRGAIRLDGANRIEICDRQLFASVNAASAPPFRRCA